MLVLLYSSYFTSASFENISPFLPIESMARLLEQLHNERDDLYEQISKLTIDGNSSALDEHIALISEAYTGRTFV